MISPTLKIELLLMLAVIITTAAQFIYSPALSYVAADFGCSETAVKNTVSCFVLGMASMFIINGTLADMIGRRPIILTATGMFFMGSFLAYISPTITYLYTARFLQGIGTSGAVLMSLVMPKDLHKLKDLPKILSRFSAAISITPLLSPSIGTFITAYSGWRSLFLILMTLSALLFFVLLYNLPETIKQRTHPSVKTILKTYGAIIRCPHFLRCVSSSGLILMLYGHFYTTAAMTFVKDKGLSLTDLGLCFTYVSLHGLMGNILNSYFLSRGNDCYAHIRFGAAGLLCTGLSMYGACHLYPTVTLFVVLAGLFEIFRGFVYGNSMSLMAKNFPQNKGMVMALSRTIEYSSLFCGLFISSFLSHPFMLYHSYLVVAAGLYLTVLHWSVKRS
jgi:DHA1 family bicyclomycin/chloramphenicol resistance-like MFS transporter